jgi:hypothetical protein
VSTEETAEDNPEWEHVWCAAQLAANTSAHSTHRDQSVHAIVITETTAS